MVCVADLGRAQNLGVPDLLVDGDRVGLRLAWLDGSEATPTLDFKELCEERRRAQAEEEERILYVAMTRARERLLLSGAVDLEHWPEQKLGAPAISWLGPALVAELPTSVQTLQASVRELEVNVSDGTRVRVGVRLNAPQTVGVVLRLEEPSIDANTIAVGEQKEEQQSLPSLSRPPEDLTQSDDPARPGDLVVPGDPGRPDTLSYTALSELERCGYRYYLERVLGLAEKHASARVEELRDDDRDGLQARVRGTIVHRLLESLDFARGEAPTEADVAILAGELGARLGPREREELVALLRMALDTDLAARLTATSRVARREYPFAFSLGPDEPLLTGVIDILVREQDGGLLVVDYKSDRVGAEQDLRALVEREYAIQRVVYALAVLRDGAPRVEIIHWFLHRPGEPVSAGYTAANRPDLEDRVAELARRARTRPFTVSREPHRGLCLTCPGRSGLCSWNDSDTLRERVGA